MTAYLRTILVAALVLSAASASLAQVEGEESGIAQGRYQETMANLAEDLGRLHHLRGSCMEAERQTWRDYMQEMIRLEDPSADRKNAMVARFNKGYSEAKIAYPDCNRDTAEEAERIARKAEKLSDAILATVQ